MKISNFWFHEDITLLKSLPYSGKFSSQNKSKTLILIFLKKLKSQFFMDKSLLRILLYSDQLFGKNNNYLSSLKTKIHFFYFRWWNSIFQRQKYFKDFTILESTIVKQHNKKSKHHIITPLKHKSHNNQNEHIHI